MSNMNNNIKNQLLDLLYQKNNIRFLSFELRNSVDILELYNWNYEYHTIKRLLNNHNLILINFNYNNISFFHSKYTILNIPLVNKYLFGSKDLKPKYKILNKHKFKFVNFDNNISNYNYGCILIEINIKFININKEIMLLFNYIPDYIREDGVIYSFHLEDLKNKLPYEIKNRWPEEFIKEQIIEFLNILGISVKTYSNNLEDHNSE